MSTIPQGDQERKDAPMYRGLLGYFPAALFEVAAHSMDSDKKHNPGAVDGPTWARGKSADHEDALIRHIIDAGQRRNRMECSGHGGPPPRGSSARDARRYHLRCLAWRALALLQEDCEAEGASPGVSSRFPEPDAIQRPEPEGGPDLYDAKTRQILAHPAQKLAVAAFRAECPLAEAVLADAEKCSWVIVDEYPSDNGYQYFHGQVFSSREKARKALRDEIDSHFQQDFSIRRVP